MFKKKVLITILITFLFITTVAGSCNPQPGEIYVAPDEFRDTVCVVHKGDLITITSVDDMSVHFKSNNCPYSYIARQVLENATQVK